MHPDMDWRLIETKTGEVVREYFGNLGSADGIQDVEFSEDGLELLKKDGKRQDYKSGRTFRHKKTVN